MHITQQPSPFETVSNIDDAMRRIPATGPIPPHILERLTKAGIDINAVQRLREAHSAIYPNGTRTYHSPSHELEQLRKFKKAIDQEGSIDPKVLADRLKAATAGLPDVQKARFFSGLIEPTADDLKGVPMLVGIDKHGKDIVEYPYGKPDAEKPSYQAMSRPDVPDYDAPKGPSRRYHELPGPEQHAAATEKPRQDHSDSGPYKGKLAWANPALQNSRG